MDKISCGGFYLGEGLTMEQVDGKPTLKAEGGGGGSVVIELHADNVETMSNITCEKTVAEVGEIMKTSSVILDLIAPTPDGGEYHMYSTAMFNMGDTSVWGVAVSNQEFTAVIHGISDYNSWSFLLGR